MVKRSGFRSIGIVFSIFFILKFHLLYASVTLDAGQSAVATFTGTQKIDGLVLASDQVVTKSETISGKPTKYYVVLAMQFSKPDRKIYIQNHEIPRNSVGEFHLRINLNKPMALVNLMTTSPNGVNEQQKILITVSPEIAVDQSRLSLKRSLASINSTSLVAIPLATSNLLPPVQAFQLHKGLETTAVLGYSLRSYRTVESTNVAEGAVTGSFDLSYYFNSSPLSLGIGGICNPLIVAGSQPKSIVTYLSETGYMSYNLAKGSWSLALILGYVSTSITSSLDTPQYVTFAYPEIYPIITKVIGYKDTVSATFKFTHKVR